MAKDESQHWLQGKLSRLIKYDHDHDRHHDHDCDQRMNMINVRRSWVLQTAVCDHCSSSCLPTKLRLHQLLTANSKTAACGKIEQWERVLKAEPAL